MQAEDALVKHKAALVALNEKDFAIATAHFTEAISLLPESCITEHALFLCDRAQAYLELSQYDQAVEDCNKSLIINPDMAMAHFRLGIAYFETNFYDEAINSYEKALKNDSSLSEQVKVKLRQVSSAKEVMERKAREAEREQKKIEEEKAREEKRAKDEAMRKEKAEKAAREKAE
jgi:tetratricopeptide (TPR) repeat protein